MPYKRNSDLPESVRESLPSHAQDIFRNAVNSAMEEQDLSEERAFQVAWAAVKRKYKKEGDRWVRKAEDHAIRPFVDDVPITSVRRTADGYMVAVASVARPGIQFYRGYEVGLEDKDIVRVYRPPEEVFHQDSLHTFAHRPVTLEHPPEPVTADNWKKYAIGQTADEIDARDGKFIRVPLVLMDAAAIQAVEDGKRELSMGYTADLSFEDGETPDGERYDAIQRTIRANHLAVVSAARGGSSLKIGDGKESGEPKMTTKTITVDGVSVEMSDVAAQVVNRALDAARTFQDASKKRIEELEKMLAEAKADAEQKAKDGDKASKDHETVVATKDAEIVTIKQQLKDAEITPAKLDQLVKDRDTVIGKGRAMIGDRLVSDSKTNAEIQRQVVDAKLGDAAKGWTDEQVTVSFQTLTADVKPADPVGRALADHYVAPSAGSAREAYDARVKRIEDAWKHPGGAAA